MSSNWQGLASVIARDSGVGSVCRPCQRNGRGFICEEGDDVAPGGNGKSESTLNNQMH